MTVNQIKVEISHFPPLELDEDGCLSDTGIKKNKKILIGLYRSI